jgi:hypothetical protein
MNVGVKSYYCLTLEASPFAVQLSLSGVVTTVMNTMIIQVKTFKTTIMNPNLMTTRKITIMSQITTTFKMITTMNLNTKTTSQNITDDSYFTKTT